MSKYNLDNIETFSRILEIKKEMGNSFFTCTPSKVTEKLPFQYHSAFEMVEYLQRKVHFIIHSPGTKDKSIKEFKLDAFKGVPVENVFIVKRNLEAGYSSSPKFVNLIDVYYRNGLRFANLDRKQVIKDNNELVEIFNSSNQHFQIISIELIRDFPETVNKVLACYDGEFETMLSTFGTYSELDLTGMIVTKKKLAQNSAKRRKVFEGDALDLILSVQNMNRCSLNGNRRYPDYISFLPTVILRYLLSFLTVEDLRSALRVSKKFFYTISKKEVLKQIGMNSALRFIPNYIHYHTYFNKYPITTFLASKVKFTTKNCKAGRIIAPNLVYEGGLKHHFQESFKHGPGVDYQLTRSGEWLIEAGNYRMGKREGEVTYHRFGQVEIYKCDNNVRDGVAEITGKSLQEDGTLLPFNFKIKFVSGSPIGVGTKQFETGFWKGSAMIGLEIRLEGIGTMKTEFLEATGTFNDGLPHGQCQVFFKKEKIGIIGNFERGKAIRGEWMKGAFRYIGELKDFMPYGYGVMSTKTMAKCTNFGADEKSPVIMGTKSLTCWYSLEKKQVKWYNMPFNEVIVYFKDNRMYDLASKEVENKRVLELDQAEKLFDYPTLKPTVKWLI